MEKITQKNFREQVEYKNLNRMKAENNLNYHDIVELIDNIKKEKIKNINIDIGKTYFTSPQRMIRNVIRDNNIIQSHMSLKRNKIYKHKNYYILLRKYYLEHKKEYKYGYVLYEIMEAYSF